MEWVYTLLVYCLDIPGILWNGYIHIVSILLGYSYKVLLTVIAVLLVVCVFGMEQGLLW